jgi:poly(A) polymerase
MNTPARDIVAQLQQAGYTAYLAGGCVRDHLLGIEAKDYDVATSARPEEVQRLFPRVTNLTGKSFGVVRVMVGEEQFEVAMFRQDGAYVDGRRPESVTSATPEIDAQRRDFTINGLFFDPVAEKLIDYVGGETDLRTGIIRAIGNPADRFAEDHLRLLRAIRFATRFVFKIEPKTWDAIRAAAPMIKTVSAERIRDELNKIFTASKPELGLDLLDRSGLLAEVLPDIAAMHGVEQPPQFHPEGDVYEHVRLMLSKIEEPNLDLALGVLFHDVGKKPTAKTDENGRIRFNEHESVGADMSEKIMTDLRYDNKTIETVKEMVQYHMQFKDVPKMRPSTLKRMMSRPTFLLELELHRIDCASSHGDLSHYDYLKHLIETMPPEQIAPPQLISGRDLIAMGLPPGKIFSRILEAVRIAQLEESVQTRIEALAMARKLASRGMETGSLPPLTENPPKAPPEKPPEDPPDNPPQNPSEDPPGTPPKTPSS